jgi:glycosyltransferase involved in cell wall biosynthesis
MLESAGMQSPNPDPSSSSTGGSGPPPLLSVVIPTYGKAETLGKVIASLERQDLARGDFEVIVIDDGSPDDTAQRLAEIAARSPLPLRVLSQENRGVSAARNRGVALARAPIVLLIQDDILAAPDLLSRHLLGHRLHPEVTATVSGRVAWPPDWPIDHFMHWLDHGGPQFRFHELAGRDRLDFKHFYTCNVSLKRQALVDNPLDEEIVYGFEDIELAHRLQRKGFTFHYDERAVGHHHHRRTFEDFERRQFAAGRSLYVAFRNHPELRGKTGITRMSVLKRLRTRARRLALPVARLLGARGVIEKYWKAKLDEQIIRGYRQAREQDGGRSAGSPGRAAHPNTRTGS